MSRRTNSTETLFARSMVAGLLVLLLTNSAGSAGTSNFDDFAKCLTSKKASMYGSSLCPHCQDQKNLFGASFAYVNYVECSVPFSRQMATPCQAAQIRHVPTWIFGDGGRRVGLTPLKELSDRTGCKLP